MYRIVHNSQKAASGLPVLECRRTVVYVSCLGNHAAR